MEPDPIVAEVRAVRDRLAARFNYDIDAIVRHIRSVEAASGRTYVQPPRIDSFLQPPDSSAAQS